MSELNEKSGLTEQQEAVANSLATAITDKADKAEVEALTEDVGELAEGMGEVITSLQDLQKSQDNLVLRLNSNGSTKPKASNKLQWTGEADSDLKQRYGTDFGSTLKMDYITKAITTNDNVDGGREDSAVPYFSPGEYDKLMAYYTTMKVSGSSIKVPKLGDVSFSHAATIPNSRSNAGSISSSDLVMNDYELQFVASIPAVEDVEAMDNTIVSQITTVAGHQRGALALAPIIADGKKGSGNAVSVVNTGLAAALPTAANLKGKLLAMMGEVDARFHGPDTVWAVNNSVYTLLLQNNAGDYDPVRQVLTLFGYPLIVTNHLDAGGAANNISAVFGNFRAGLFCGDRQSLVLQRFGATNPGAITYYANFRLNFTVLDGDALAVLKTKA